MSKPTPLQFQVIDAIVQELAYWQTSNDINSPSHGTSIDNDMFSNLDEWWADDAHSRADELSNIAGKVAELWVLIAKLNGHE